MAYKMNNVITLSGEEVTPKTNTALSIVDTSTSFVSGLLNPFLANKHETEMTKLNSKIQSDNNKMQILLAESQQATSAIVRDQKLAELEKVKLDNQLKMAQLQQLQNAGNNGKKAITPLGYGVIGLAGVGVILLLKSKTRKRR